jgi:hypothetical protein
LTENSRGEISVINWVEESAHLLEQAGTESGTKKRLTVA